MTRSSLPARVLYVAAFLAAGCASGGPAPAAPPEAPAPPAATPDAPVVPQPPEEAEPSDAPVPATAGVYSAGQADRGATAFDEVCAECHTTSEFRGSTFQRNWGRRTVYSFFRTVRSTMPDNDPGALEEQVYLDVVSYIMRMNGHEPGPAEMSPDSPMREVRMDPSTPHG